MLNSRVGEFVNQQGMWDMAKLRFWLPNDVCEQIRTLVPPTEANNEDVLAWRGSPNCSFSVARAYKVVTSLNKDKDPLFVSIWRWKGPEKVRLYLWKVVRNALLTNDLRCQRGLTHDSRCALCNTSSNEDTLHVMWIAL